MTIDEVVIDWPMSHRSGESHSSAATSEKKDRWLIIFLISIKDWFLSSARNACRGETSSWGSDQSLPGIPRYYHPLPAPSRTHLLSWFARARHSLALSCHSVLDLFEKRLKYNLVVYECQDADVQHYIYEFLHHLKPFFHKQLIDQIGFAIGKDDENIVLRRYLFELHPIIDHSSNTMHKDGHRLLAELDAIFSDCLKELMRQPPISPPSLSPETSNDQIHWKLQTRLCRHGIHLPEIDETFVEQFRLAEDLSMPIQPIRSLHAQRLHLQLMCQDQAREQQWAFSIEFYSFSETLQ